MVKSSLLKFTITLVIFLLFIIGYIGWKLWGSSKATNQTAAEPNLSSILSDDREASTGLNAKQPCEDINQKIYYSHEEPSVDTSDWKTFRHDDYALEVKYPSYYYAIPTTKPAPLWGIQKTPVFSLILSEVSPGGGVKDT